MNSQRPVNLKISTIKLPITAYVSILHRISGFILFIGITLMLLLLHHSLATEEGFESVKDSFANPLVKLVVWAMLSALMYHVVAGIRHLIMDIGIGETIEGGRTGSKIVIAVAVVLIIATGVWIW